MSITFEARQLMSNFFNPDEDPVGHVGKGVLIVPGQHARLRTTLMTVVGGSRMNHSAVWEI